MSPCEVYNLKKNHDGSSVCFQDIEVNVMLVHTRTFFKNIIFELLRSNYIEISQKITIENFHQYKAFYEEAKCHKN